MSLPTFPAWRVAGLIAVLSSCTNEPAVEAPTSPAEEARLPRITRAAYAIYVRQTGEYCDGLDNDGDGLVDEAYPDLDGDGAADCWTDDWDWESTAGPTCGDGVIDPGETCDDGGPVGGDGCSDACQVETCTYGMGWWKTHHAGASPAALDLPWPVPEDTRLCGYDWLQILQAPTRGNPFHLFARVWVTAQLNRANGAGGPPEVDLALYYGERVLRDCVVLRPEYERARRVVDVLSAYNDGTLGIGSCEDDCGGDGCGFPDEACDGVDNDGDGLIDEDGPDADVDGLCDALDGEDCDGVDNDGDGEIDEGLPDVDGDGVCDARDVEDCDARDNDGDGEIDEGFADSDGDGWADCVDVETCDGLDNDGNGVIDEGFPDGDHDGVPDCLDSEDCDGVDNDGDGQIDEDTSDIDGDGVCDGRDVESCDGLDNDGNGAIDEGYRDTDGDGVADCVDVETCDGVDNDGDGRVDEGFPDSDADGVADCQDTESCDGLDNDGDGAVDEGFDGDGDGATSCGGDCDDTTAAIGPAVADVCDGVDNDCDGQADEGLDADGDGTADCFDGEDCDGRDNDGDGLIDEGIPDADGDGTCDERDFETCDGIDNDGDGQIDEGLPDTDGDGVADCIDAETCDGLDNDGDGEVDQGFPDGDDDGVADCVDVETCDGLDNNGDGRTDEGFPDGDGDGVADCVDDEACNGVDDDADGVIDEGHDGDGDGRADCLETCSDMASFCSASDGATTVGSGAPAVETWPLNPRWTATIPGATWLWDAYFEGTPVSGRTLDFDRSFVLPGEAINLSAILSISADNSYETWVNGWPTGADPTEFGYFAPADVWDVTDAVMPGENLFEARVVNWPMAGGTETSNPGGLLYCVSVAWEVDEDEVCNGVDDDCDGLVDEGQADGDGDGLCDARDTETCDGVDNDGDGQIDEGLSDVDGDGICDGRDPETCDGVDNDGDGQVDEGQSDRDGDGVCDALDSETCDRIDNDGDGQIDEGFHWGNLYQWSQAGGGTGTAGTIEWTYAAHDELLSELTFETRIAHPAGARTKLFTVAINDGPNPKGQGDLALLYFDATGAEPVVTVYAYNGENTFTSYYDGSSVGGVQTPDRMFSSLLDDSFLSDAWFVDDGARITMGFTVSLVPIRNWTPLHVGAWSWYGMGFDDTFGIWYHPAAGVTTSYSDGWLSSYTYTHNSWIDNSDQPASTTPVCHPLP
jgi:hypothetical protein